MSARNPELPEGTDHIVNGAFETGEGARGASSTGFIGSAADDDTGGTSSGGGIGRGTGTTAGIGGGSGGGDFGGSGAGDGLPSGSGGSGSDIRTQLRDGASSIKDQAAEKARTYAEEGKTRATTALDDLSKVVSDAAGSIDERLGSEYGEYARKAADSVAGFADTLRNKEVDDLYNGARDLVRKSPAIAIGAAAVVGFTLIRLIKSGMDDKAQTDVDFEPDNSVDRGA